MDTETHPPAEEANAAVAEETAATFDETFDPDETPAFLAPRLAAYATAATLDAEDVVDEDGSQEADVGIGKATVINEEEEEETGAVEMLEETDAAPSTLRDVGANENDETYDYAIEDDLGVDVDEDTDGGDSEASDFPRDQRGGDDFTTVFPVSRVKDLLKYEGSSTIISRDACLAASEAVALILRDMARSAAAEAQRRNRKTVTYDDVARTVMMYDRFAYLAEVVPPVQTSAGRGITGAAGSSGSASHVIVGAPARSGTRATKAQREQQQLGDLSPLHTNKGNAAAGKGKSAASSSAGGKGKGPAGGASPPSSSGHPIIPGADTKRQTTLRF